MSWYFALLNLSTGDLRFATRVFCRQIRGHDATSVKNLGESFLGLVNKVKKLRLHILDPFLGINQPANTTQLKLKLNPTQTQPNPNQLNFSTNPTTTRLFAPRKRHHPIPLPGSTDGGPRDAGDYFDDGLEHCAGLDPVEKVAPENLALETFEFPMQPWETYIPARLPNGYPKLMLWKRWTPFKNGNSWYLC